LTDMQTKDIDYGKEARKARNRALIALFTGLGLIIVAAYCVGGVMGSAIGVSAGPSTVIALVVAASIAGFASIMLLFAALTFLMQYVVFKRRIKNPERGEIDEPKYPGF